MSEINHWDFADSLTAVQAALLIEGKDPGSTSPDGRGGMIINNVSEVILGRMSDDYMESLARYRMGSIEPYKKFISLQVPFASKMMDVLLTEAVESGNYNKFDEWLSDFDEGDFDKQIFTRKSIHNWLKVNGLPSKYLFVKPDNMSAQCDAGKDGTLNGVCWPWGFHHTELLGHLDAAARRYWGAGYDPSDTSTASTNATVSEWLHEERGVSKTMADSIASILRPDGLPTGPRR